MSKKKRKAESRELVKNLVEQLGLPKLRAEAIVKRYGPSRERCMQAAVRYVRLRRLIGARQSVNETNGLRIGFQDRLRR
jgi:hypothetical protein